jgi:hypothetical protein
MINLTASLANFQIAVDMTAANFEMHLPEVLNLIESSDLADQERTLV